ncbi:hypothetical protein CRG98_006797 [Punica granatum]|uniref:Retrotransposon gag domain-containing protein n=1 Tax=Punica granatum TaxID=22663 RepID=A0A2I0KWI2_PUNGR|nr:hypothetical protein CRG98_006797 [Punica granatum]
MRRDRRRRGSCCEATGSWNLELLSSPPFHPRSITSTPGGTRRQVETAEEEVPPGGSSTSWWTTCCGSWSPCWSPSPWQLCSASSSSSATVLSEELACYNYIIRCPVKIVGAQDVKLLRDDLRERYSQGHQSRIYQIKSEICLLKQEGCNIRDYYDKMKVLWDELETYLENSACNCGAAAQRETEKDRTSRMTLGVGELRGEGSTVWVEWLILQPFVVGSLLGRRFSIGDSSPFSKNQSSQYSF